MQTLKIFAALGALLFSSLVHAQAYFVCGDVACPANTDPSLIPATGVNDLVVDGDAFNVTFTHALPSSSPFVFSQYAAAPGQPLTGVDAANALLTFYETQLEPSPELVVPGPVLITAFQQNTAAGTLNIDGVGTFFDNELDFPGEPGPVSFAPDIGSGGPVFTEQYINLNLFPSVPPWNVCAIETYECTVWTPIAAAPEIDPMFAASGLALLLGGIAVLRGRKQGIEA